MGEAYRWLYGGCLPTSGREPSSAPAHEVYLNSPMIVHPEDLLTEIHLPLQPAGLMGGGVSYRSQV